jgi:hypothetical protein
LPPQLSSRRLSRSSCASGRPRAETVLRASLQQSVAAFCSLRGVIMEIDSVIPLHFPRREKQ